MLRERAAGVFDEPAREVLLAGLSDATKACGVRGHIVDVVDGAEEIEGHAPDGAVEVMVVGILREIHLQIVTRERGIVFDLMGLVECVEIERLAITLKVESVLGASAGDSEVEAEGIEEALLQLLAGDAAAVAVDVAMIGERIEAGTSSASVAWAGRLPGIWILTLFQARESLSKLWIGGDLAGKGPCEGYNDGRALHYDYGCCYWWTPGRCIVYLDAAEDVLELRKAREKRKDL